jgi:hypothetical protein
MLKNPLTYENHDTALVGVPAGSEQHSGRHALACGARRSVSFDRRELEEIYRKVWVW